MKVIAQVDTGSVYNSTKFLVEARNDELKTLKGNDKECYVGQEFDIQEDFSLIKKIAKRGTVTKLKALRNELENIDKYVSDSIKTAEELL